jgi:hypothetical protein
MTTINPSDEHCLKFTIDCSLHILTLIHHDHCACHAVLKYIWQRQVVSLLARLIPASPVTRPAAKQGDQIM